MEFRLVKDSELDHWYATDFCEAFPPCERKPLAVVREQIAQGIYELFGLYDGEKMVAFAGMWYAPDRKDYALLDYLATTAARRNGGLGAEVLRRLIDYYGGRTRVLLEAEAEREEDDGENALRRRRQGFYRRNGFQPLYEMATCGTRFVAFLDGTGPADVPEMMEAHRVIYGPARVDVVVPLPADMAPPPSPFQ